MKLAEKVAIITGAGSGFGEGIAKRFAEEGATVVIADINHSNAVRVASDIGENAVALHIDVTNKDDIDRMIKSTEEAFGRLDILVNNAGYTSKNGSMFDVDENTFDRIFDVNVKAIYHATLAVAPVFKKYGGGSIINVASVGANRPRPGLTWYNGSKAAALNLTKGTAVELAPDNIRVNAICPVLGDTGLLEEFMGKADSEENRRAFLATIPLGRLAQPADIAGAAVYLSSDDANFITGTSIDVDGGRSV